MSTLVFLLEEESAKNMLQGIASRLIPEDVTVRYIVFEGKQDLEKQLVRKIRAWLEPDSRFIILRDKDAGDCRMIKERLLSLIGKTGKRDSCLVRIACHELESFFLGDLSAVARALNVPGLERKQNKAPYRTPDSIANAAEELYKITNKKYKKLSGSRAVSPLLRVDGQNVSPSFRALCDGIRSQVAVSARCGSESPISKEEFHDSACTGCGTV